MNKDALTNFGRKNIEAIDKFLSVDAEDCAFLQRNYTMIQTNSYNPVEITEDSRKKCVASLLR